MEGDKEGIEGQEQKKALEVFVSRINSPKKHRQKRNSVRPQGGASMKRQGLSVGSVTGMLRIKRGTKWWGKTGDHIQLERGAGHQRGGYLGA